MAHYHQPPAVLTKAEWEEVSKILKDCTQPQVVEKLRKANNQPQRAGDLFAGEYVYSRGQDQVNKALREANSPFVLGRIAYENGISVPEREERMLAFVRKPQEEASQ